MGDARQVICALCACTRTGSARSGLARYICAYSAACLLLFGLLELPVRLLCALSACSYALGSAWIAACPTGFVTAWQILWPGFFIYIYIRFVLIYIYIFLILTWWAHGSLQKCCGNVAFLVLKSSELSLISTFDRSKMGLPWYMVSCLVALAGSDTKDFTNFTNLLIDREYIYLIVTTVQGKLQIQCCCCEYCIYITYFNNYNKHSKLTNRFSWNQTLKVEKTKLWVI